MQGDRREFALTMLVALFVLLLVTLLFGGAAALYNAWHGLYRASLVALAAMLLVSVVCAALPYVLINPDYDDIDMLMAFQVFGPGAIGVTVAMALLACLMSELGDRSRERAPCDQPEEDVL